MGDVGRKAVQAPCVGLNNLHARLFDFLAALVHALVAPGRINVDDAHALGSGAHARIHGMKAGKNNLFAHRNPYQ